MSQAGKSNVRVVREKVGPDGLITTHTGVSYDEDQRVDTILTQTWGAETWNGWQTHGYRLAYGVLTNSHGVRTNASNRPRELQWVSPVLSKQYNPTLHELFVNTPQRQGEDYYLLISKLDASERHSKWVQMAMHRFSSLFMADLVQVNMWRVTAEGDVESTGWPYDPEETLFALFNKTDSWWDWKNYRLAYGAGRLFSPPRLPQWAHLSIAENPTITMRQFFADVTLADGEGYFLMISRLGDDGTPRQTQLRSELRVLYPLEEANAHVHAQDAGTSDGGPHRTLARMRALC
jgi:hypothetical protein